MHKYNTNRTKSCLSHFQTRQITYSTGSNPYEILQVRPTDSKQVIKTKYYKLCQKYHPDINPSKEAKEKMAEINNAYDYIRSVHFQYNISQKAYRGYPFANGTAWTRNYYQSSAFASTDDFDAMLQRMKREQRQHFYSNEPNTETMTISLMDMLKQKIPFGYKPIHKSTDLNEEFDVKFTKRQNTFEEFKSIWNHTRSTRVFKLWLYIISYFFLFVLSLTIIEKYLKMEYKKQRNTYLRNRNRKKIGANETYDSNSQKKK